MKRFPVSFVISLQATSFPAVGRASSPGEAFDELGRLGYDGVELAVRDPGQVKPQELARLLEKYSLLPTALGTGQAFVEEGLSLTDPRARVRRRTLIRLKSHFMIALELRVPVIIIGLIRGRTSPGMGRERCLELLREALVELSGLAQGSDVRFALEPINRYETDLVCTLAEACELLDRVPGRAIGILPDVFHMNLEEADPFLALETYGPRAVHFHVADSNRWAPGHGHLDLRKWFKSLNRSGYRGAVSVECLPRPPDTARAALATLSRLGLGRKKTAEAEGEANQK